MIRPSLGWLSAIVGWDFAGLGDPMSDLAGFCAEGWSFGRNDLEADGIASRDAFYAGYRAEGGGEIDDETVRYWEVVTLAQRALRLLEPRRPVTLDTALNIRAVAELELRLMRATGSAAWRSHAG